MSIFRGPTPSTAPAPPLDPAPTPAPPPDPGPNLAPAPTPLPARASSIPPAGSTPAAAAAASAAVVAGGAAAFAFAGDRLHSPLSWSVRQSAAISSSCADFGVAHAGRVCSISSVLVTFWPGYERRKT